MRFDRFLYVTLTLVILFWGACIELPMPNIKMETIPELKVGSPLSGVKPVTFYVKRFGDEVGEMIEVIPVGHAKGFIKIDIPANQLFSQAIANELKRNGHTVFLYENDGKADIIVDGVAKKYLIEFPISTFHSRNTGYAEAEITLIKISDATESMSKLYRGSFDCRTVDRTCLYETLLDMVKDFSTDPDLLEFVKSVRKD